MIYVYAIGDRCPTGWSARGLGGASVSALPVAGLTAFVTTGLEAAPHPEARALSDHHRVTVSLMEDATVLPMRFGTVVEDPAELSRALAARSAELARSVARLRGRVELGVRALWGGPREPERPASGREFMAAELELRRNARAAARELHTPLAALAADSVCRTAPTEDTAFAAAYLVDRREAPAFERRATELGSGRSDLALVCTGPWPPYSFSEASDA